MKNKIADIYDSSAQGIEKKHIPELRFPEFTGEWEDNKLGEIGEFIRGLSYNNTEITSETSSTLVLRSNNIIQDREVDYKCGLQYVTKKPATEQILKKGDIAICLANGSSNLVGKSASFDGKYHGVATVGAFCGIYRSDSPIVKYLVQTSAYKEKINLIKQGGNGALANLYGKDILSLTFKFPPTFAEQQKLAECLSSIDEQILATQQKWDSLKEYKRGLMQRLFPANGKTTPDFRFPEFANAGEWEEKKLGEVAEKKNTRNRNLFVSRVLSNSATEGIVDQNTYFGRNIAVKENTENYYVVDFNDFVYNPRISTLAPVGPISINKIGKGIMSPIYIIFRFKKGMFVDYWKHYFSTSIWHKYLKGIANFGARFDRMNITNEDFFNMPLLIPSLAEQEKIADCLSALDEMIAAQAQKTEALKEHKRGLMQKLFPNNNMDFKK